LLVLVSSVIRVLLTTGLVLVWAMPPVVAVQVWLWMTNYENGVVNYILTKLHVGDYMQHDWYASTFSMLSLVTALIVWGAIPFVVVTVYAGLSQVPDELVEAAEIDGARPFRVFKDVTVPILKPIFLILTSLWIIWDFGVFTRTAWNLVGILVLVILAFPVFWMVSTAFKSDEQINSLNPTWFSLHPTLAHFGDAIHRPFFWDDVKNSLIIVSVTVALSMALAF